MRTLQEKYNGIQEGKFSKDQFLVEARQQLPNLVTRYNGYDDAIQILKNRGMIKEVKHTYDFSDYTNNDLAHVIIDKSRYEGTEEEVQAAKEELERRKGTVKEANKAKGRRISDSPYVVYTDEKGKHQLEDFTYEDDLKAFLKTIPDTWDVYETRREANGELSRRIKEVPQKFIKEAKLTKKSLTDYRYKPTNDMDKYPYEQILRGLRVELEGLGIKDIPTAEEYSKALAKVSKNLEKDSIFYTNQVAGVNKKTDLHDKMIPIDPKKLFKTSSPQKSKAEGNVDTFNDLKKAQLKEGFKRLIKKVLSENIETTNPNSDKSSRDPLEDYMEAITPKPEEEKDIENYKTENEIGTIDRDSKLEEAIDNNQDIAIFSVSETHLGNKIDRALKRHFGKNLSHQGEDYTLPREDYDTFINYLRNQVGNKAEEEVAEIAPDSLQEYEDGDDAEKAERNADNPYGSGKEYDFYNQDFDENVKSLSELLK